MLRNTFCHLPGIGVKSERDLWGRGIHEWDNLLNGSSAEFQPARRHLLKTRLKESLLQFRRGNAKYFEKRMPASESWRLFYDYRDETAYLDIESTGMGRGLDHITTIAMYDGHTVHHYVYGRNLEQFVHDIQRFKLLVSFNGKCFDIPFIEKSFKIKLNQAHIDLRFLLKSLGYSGGLKGCEKQLGLDRKELDGVNGYFAVLLWEDFEWSGNERALETLLAYNVLDAVNLETLMVLAYNMKLKDTPFYPYRNLPVPAPPQNPFEADMETVQRILAANYRHLVG
jgi:uncharacterized protein